MTLSDAASSRLDELKQMGSDMPAAAPDAGGDAQSMVEQAITLLEQASATPGFEGLRDIVTQLQTVSPKVDTTAVPTTGATGVPAGAGQI